MKRLLLLVVFLLLAGFLWQRTPAPEATAVGGVAVSQSEYGDAWPFTVDSGIVDCITPPALGAAVFRSGRQTYQLNGVAKMAGYAPIDPIWRDNVHTLVGTKVNIGPMIDLALEQCGN